MPKFNERQVAIQMTVGATMTDFFFSERNVILWSGQIVNFATVCALLSLKTTTPSLFTPWTHIKLFLISN